ncbi:MAG: alpha/beta hydrolase [Anaerolineae bacterium]
MKRRILVGVAITGVLLLVAYLGASYMVYDKLSRVPPVDQAKMNNRPSDYRVTYAPDMSFDVAPYQMPSYETVSFPSLHSNITLRGWYMEVDPSAPAVVVTHGLGTSKKDSNVLVPAAMLAQHGFNVLMYDLRNHGESDSDNGRTSIGNKEYLDVLGAWHWLVDVKGYSPSRVGLYGVSLGGGTTLIAFGEEPQVAAAFVDSPFFNLREIMDAELIRNHYPTPLAPAAIFLARVTTGEDLVAHSPSEAITADRGRPLFVVHGTGDSRISVNQTRELLDFGQESGANISAWIPEGVEHVDAVFRFPDEYERRLIDFFTAALKQ